MNLSLLYYSILAILSVIEMISNPFKTRREDVELTYNKVGIHDVHNIDISNYAKFQEFDFCKLEGVGDPLKEPYVLIRDSAEFKIIRRSDDIYNPYIFQNMGEYWYNYTGYYMEFGPSARTLGGLGPAQSMRFVENDTLYEYLTEYFDDNVHTTYKIYPNYKHKITIGYSLTKKNGKLLAGEDYTFSTDLFKKIKSQMKSFMKKIPDGRYILHQEIIYTDSCMIERPIGSNGESDIKVRYSPLGEIDYDNAKPRCYDNAYGWK